MSRRVVDHVLALRESHGFLRGLVGLVGFEQTSVLFDRDSRVSGKSKYNRFWGSLAIGLNGVIGFSRYPLQVSSLLGIALAGFAFLLALVYLGLKLGGVWPDRQPDHRHRGLVLQRDPAAVAGRNGRVRRAHLRGGAGEAEA